MKEGGWMTPPDLDRMNALFLDLDGTLLEIAETPESVVVPPGLPQLLESLRAELDGAVAIVTGRSIGVIDDLLNPFVATAAGEHGASMRYQDGKIEEMPKGLAVPEAWREALVAAAERWPGVLVEPKPHGVAIHYRLVPERGNDVWRLVRALVPPVAGARGRRDRTARGLEGPRRGAVDAASAFPGPPAHLRRRRLH
jgi:trehalose 6-phosphate phosphatase